jgi:6-phosphogluconolactonase (cycloisomerase 2 family)
MTKLRAWLSVSLAAAAVSLTSCSGGGGGGTSSPAAPSKLAYAHNPAILPVGLAVVADKPTYAGEVTSWSISPSLPTGLKLNKSDGTISGTPTELAARASYEVTAKGPGGEASVELDLTVARAAAFALAGGLADDTVTVLVLDPESGLPRPWSYSPAPAGQEWPGHMVAHPGGSPLYVVNRDTDNVTVWDFDMSVGRVTPRAVVPTGKRPFSIALHPQSLAAYVTYLEDGAVQAFSIDPLDGGLTPLGAPLPTGQGPDGLAVDPDGRFLYVGNTTSRTLRTFAIDAQTGALSQAGADVPAGEAPLSMTVTRDGRFLYVVNAASSSLFTYSLDALSGLPTLIDELEVGFLPAAVLIEPTGRFLYVAVSGERRVRSYAIDAASGVLKETGAPVVTPVQPSMLATDGTGRFVYVSTTSGSQVSLLAIDPLVGSLSMTGTVRTRDLPLAFTVVTPPKDADPAPRFAYVTNRGSSDISSYVADGEAGRLKPAGSPILTGLQPRGIAVDPWLRYAFTANSGSDDISMFAVDQATGDLTEIGPRVPAGMEPRALAVEPSGRFVYVANQGESSVSSFAIDEQNGALVALGTHTVGKGPIALTVEPTGRFLYVANRDAGTLSALAIDVASGALTPIAADLHVDALPRTIQAHPDGSLVFATFASTGELAVFRVNPQTGALSAGPSAASGSTPTSVAVDPLGRFAFVTNLQPLGVGDLSRFALDPGSDQPTLLGTLLAGVNPIDSALDPSGRFLYVTSEGSDDISVFAVDPSDGSLALVDIEPAGVSPASIVVAGKFGL